MARGVAVILRVTGGTFVWTTDRADTDDGELVGTGTAATLGAAINAVAPFITGLPGTISKVQIIGDSFVPGQQQ